MTFTDPLETIVAALASFAVLALMFVPLERAFPARRAQHMLRRDLVIDLCFFAGQYLVFASIALLVLRALAPHIAALGPESARAHLATLPLALQCLIGVVAGDVVVYWWHRACHAVPLLWRFHAVHHSAEELDWVAAHREHPLDGITTQLCMNAPALVLGVPIEALAAIAVFRGLWAIFIHSNVCLPFSLGPLRVLLGAPELHHWHHARVPRTHHNFANLAPYLDVIFGTYHCPPSSRSGEERYPLGVVGAWPRHYLAQLIRPFRSDP